MTSPGTEEHGAGRQARALGVVGVAVFVAVLAVACGSSGATGSRTSTAPGVLDGAHADPSMLLTPADLPKLAGQGPFTPISGPDGIAPGPVFGDAASLRRSLAQQRNDAQSSSFCSGLQGPGSSGGPVPSSFAGQGCPSTTTLPPTVPRTAWPEPVWAMLGHPSCDSVHVATPTAWGAVGLSTDEDPTDNGLGIGNTVYELVTVYASAADAEAAMSLPGDALENWLLGWCPHAPADSTSGDLVSFHAGRCTTSLGDQCLALTEDFGRPVPTVAGQPDQPASLLVRRGNVVVWVRGAGLPGFVRGCPVTATLTLVGPDGSAVSPSSTGAPQLPECNTTTTNEPVEHLTSAHVVDITRTALAKLP